VNYARPRVIRGTRVKPLPLLPSRPGGVCSRPLHGARDLTNLRLARDGKPTSLRLFGSRLSLFRSGRSGLKRFGQQPFRLFLALSRHLDYNLVRARQNIQPCHNRRDAIRFQYFFHRVGFHLGRKTRRPEHRGHSIVWDIHTLNIHPSTRYPKPMRSTLLATLLMSCSAFAQTSPAWIARSNQNTQILIDIDSKYSPEDASEEGLRSFDDLITVLSPERHTQLRADYVKAREQLQAKLAAEKDPLVRQDLEILIHAADREIRNNDAAYATFLPYTDIGGTIFYGMKGLLDDQIAADRRPSAVTRLKKYTGIENGFSAMTTMAEARFRERLNTPGLLGPSKDQVEKDLGDTNTYITGIGLLLEKYNQKDYQDALAKLKEQLTEYDTFLRREVVPKARTDFRLPPEIYKIRLDNAGVDYTPEELEKLGHSGFTDIEEQMKPIAARIAAARKLPSADYRDVIRELKKEQFGADEILPHYQKRLAEIEDIVRANKLVTLPSRPAIIRLASAAETAASPPPHMVPPPLLNNHGERGQFVLPLETSGKGGEALKYDDFNFAAASWTLIAHEARPGHELQFDSMVENGISLARALYAFDTTNVEGWGLYSEWFMLPYMPDDGKLISLQLRMLRAARAFLDPELQEGKITPEYAMRVLQDDVVVSKAFATEEVERFTFRWPGQAVSYYDGYTRLLEIRQAAEKAMGAKFNVQKFHDFILSQGLLPPDLLRKAVMEDFVAAAK